MMMYLVRRPLSTSIRRAFATVARPSSLPAIVSPSTSEIKTGSLNDRNLEIAVRGVHEDGLVVIKDVIDHDFLDHLNEKMVRDARMLQAKGDKGPFNYNQGNLQQDPPPYAKYFNPAIFTNSIATQVTTAVLGPKPRWTFCSGNSAMPALPGASPQRQPVHSDADFSHPNHPFALVVNVGLIEMSPHTGSTEVWLGTHTNNVSSQEGKHGERASGRIKEDLLEERRSVRPPAQPVVPKGSIVIRDLRLWHAGMPNQSDQVRVMLAMIHFAPWYRNPMRLEFASDVEKVMDHSGLQVPVDWISKEEAKKNYLDRGFGNSYDFNQEQ